jgi:hypothetical protein
MPLRKGMWVQVDGHDSTGILVTFTATHGTVHWVDADGHTTGVDHEIDLADVSQASLLDIPEARRPDIETAVALGYATEEPEA